MSSEALFFRKQPDLSVLLFGGFLPAEPGEKKGGGVQLHCLGLGFGIGLVLVVVQPQPYVKKIVLSPRPGAHFAGDGAAALSKMWLSPRPRAHVVGLVLCGSQK